MNGPDKMGCEKFIRYYIPVPLVSLADVFAKWTDGVLGKPFCVRPQPLGALLRYYEIEDRTASSLLPDSPPKAVAWQSVTYPPSQEDFVVEEGPLSIIADKVVSVATLKKSNHSLCEDLEKDGYAALAHHGSNILIPLRRGDVVTNRSLQIISWEESRCSPEELSLAPH